MILQIFGVVALVVLVLGVWVALKRRDQDHLPTSWQTWSRWWR